MSVHVEKTRLYFKTLTQEKWYALTLQRLTWNWLKFKVGTQKKFIIFSFPLKRSFQGIFSCLEILDGKA